MERLTELELDIVSHTLGIAIDRARNSKKKKDKKLPKEFSRNYFCSDRGGEDYNCLLSLEERGLTRRWEKFGNLYFSVTERGIELFKTEFNNYVTQTTVG